MPDADRAAVVGGRPGHDPRFDAARSAVIVVDVQNDYCDPGGAAGRAGADMSAVGPMLSRLAAFLDQARRWDVGVIFVRTTHDTADESPIWAARKQGGASDRPASGHCRPDSWGAQFCRVGPRPGEPVITKHRYSAFAGTSLDLVLRANAYQSLLFTGVATEVCVESSLRDALFLDYYVTLVADCCASYFPESHRRTIDVVRRSFGVVTTADDVVSRWAGVVTVTEAGGSHR